jgi:hypothetical protein
MNEWMDLCQSIAQILEVAMVKVAEGPVDRQLIRQNAQRRAAEVTEQIRLETKHAVSQLTLRAINENTPRDELRAQILNSPIFSAKRAQALARREMERLEP